MLGQEFFETEKETLANLNTPKLSKPPKKKDKPYQPSRKVPKRPS